MITVLHKDGTKIDYQDQRPPECLLAKACYADNIKAVEEVLSQHKSIDVDAAVIHSPTRGNGTPLVLTSSRAIGEVLMAHGAYVNHPYNASYGAIITPLDSARKELKKRPVINSPQKRKQVEDYIDFLISKGGKSYVDLCS